MVFLGKSMVDFHERLTEEASTVDFVERQAREVTSTTLTRH